MVGATKKDNTRGARKTLPPAGLLLAVDTVYRHKAEAGELPLFRRRGKEVRVVPVLTVNCGEWRFIARCKRSLDKVVIYTRHRTGKKVRRTLVEMETWGRLAGRRVVRGRERECVEYYRRIAPETIISMSRDAAAASMLITMALPTAAAPPVLSETNAASSGIIDVVLDQHMRVGLTAAGADASVPHAPGVAKLYTLDTRPPAMPALTTARAAHAQTVQPRVPGSAKLTEPDTHSAAMPAQTNAHVAHVETAEPAVPASAKLDTHVSAMPAQTTALDVKEAVSNGLGDVTQKANRQDAVPQRIDSALADRGPNETVQQEKTVQQETAPDGGRRVDMRTLVASADLPVAGYSGDVWVSEPITESAEAVEPALPASISVEEQQNSSTRVETAFRENKRSNPGISFDPREHDSYWDMKMKSDLLGGGLVATGQLAFSSFDPYAEDGFGDDRYRAMRFDLERLTKEFRYGARYRSAGDDFERLKKNKGKLLGNNKGKFEDDQETFELWGSRSFGKLKIETAYVWERDNLKGDADDPRYVDQAARVKMSHMLSKWPYLGYSISYGIGSRESSNEPAGDQPYSGPTERVGASLDYSSRHAKAWLGTYFTRRSDELSDGRDSRFITYSLGGTYYPSSTSGISTSLQHSNQFYEKDQSRYQGRWASLNMYRRFARGRVSVNGYVSYYDTRNPAWALDAEGLFASARLEWRLNKKGLPRKTVGVYLTRNQYIGHESSYDGDDNAVWFVFKFNDDRVTLLNRAYSLASDGDLGMEDPYRPR